MQFVEWQWEHFLDAGCLPELIPALTNQSNIPTMLRAFHARQFDLVEQSFEQEFSRAESVRERAFLLQFPICAAEIEYDLKKRNRYLERWQQIQNFRQDAYARYLYQYQEGVTAFYAGQLLEAERQFKAALLEADDLGYARGEMRSKFHLGLIYRDRELDEEAIAYLNEADQLAANLNSQSFRERVISVKRRMQQSSVALAIQSNLEPRAILADMMKEVELLILAKDISRARELLARAEILRRRSNIGRHYASLYLCLALLAEVRGKAFVSQLLQAKMIDPVIRLRFLDSFAKIRSLHDEESSEVEFLRKTIGGNTRESTDRASFSSQVRDKICRIDSDELRSFLSLLLASRRSVSKAEIVEKLWNHTYDPVRHDNRLYKLAARARKALPIKDFLQNKYGAYRANPKYLN